MKLLLCFGTRPEAIKMAPLVKEFQKTNLSVKVCVTAQHREMLDQVLDFFEIVPDYDLNLMQAHQTLNQLSAQILSKIDAVLEVEAPDWVFVHGDTTTSSMVALAAFHRQIKIAHVEAGLRTYQKNSPFPEEMNRQLTAKLADLHFAPTVQAEQNLLSEGVHQAVIHCTGNTVVDALLWAKNKIDYQALPVIENLKKQIDFSKKLVLVTGHRRENFGQGFESFCEALLILSKEPNVQLLYPVHLNPNVQEPVHRILSHQKNILLTAPVSYPEMIWLLQQATLIISDSGGIQEEAPTFGKMVLVTRATSERMEGILSGCAKLVGTDKHKIIAEAQFYLNHLPTFDASANPYGDGQAVKRIVEILTK